MTASAAEIPFTLPRGFVDATGQVHRDGGMRLATAADEILPLRDPRVQANPVYLTVIILSRVITRLGSLGAVTPATVEGLYTADLDYLEALYTSVNRLSGPQVCSMCGGPVPTPGDGPGK